MLTRRTMVIAALMAATALYTALWGFIGWHMAGVTAVPPVQSTIVIIVQG